MEEITVFLKKVPKYINTERSMQLGYRMLYKFEEVLVVFGVKCYDDFKLVLEVCGAMHT